ncbi:MAG: FxsA family protein [Pseudomonadota bacterium]
MWLLIAFIAVPLIEIALFIQVGGLIGLWPTLAIVLLTAFLGTYLVRSQGARAMGDLRGSFQDLRDPTEPLAHGAMILISAVLLLTPGFFTDAVGFGLLIPGIRAIVITAVRKRVKVARFEMGGAPSGGPGHHPRHNPRRNTQGDVIEGEFDEVSTPPRDPSAPPSGWTRE